MPCSPHRLWLTRPGLTSWCVLGRGTYSKQLGKLAKATFVRAIELLPTTPAAPTPPQHGVVCVGLFHLWDRLEGKSKEWSFWKCHVGCRRRGSSGAASVGATRCLRRAGIVMEHVKIPGLLLRKGCQGRWLMPGEVIDLRWWAWGGRG